MLGRGLERRDIFEQDDDKADFVSRLQEGLRSVETECLAWAVMPNHYHLLLHVNTRPLSDLMRRHITNVIRAPVMFSSIDSNLFMR